MSDISGPWEIQEHAAPFECRVVGPIREDGSRIVVYQGDLDKVAILISLAPELLEALRRLREEVRAMTDRVGWAGTGARTITDALLAKLDAE